MLGYPLVVGFLLQSGSNVNNFDINPIILASRYGNVECVSILLQNKADINCTDSAVNNIYLNINGVIFYFLIELLYI